MSSPRILTRNLNAGISNPVSLFTLPSKRGRTSPSEHDFDLPACSRRRKQLRIEIPTTIPLPHEAAHSQATHPESVSVPSTTANETPSSLFSATSLDSLFDDISSSLGLSTPGSQCTSHRSATSPSLLLSSSSNHTGSPCDNDRRRNPRPALLIAPPIQGLYFDPSLRLPQELADEVVDFCLRTYFRRPNVNQVMLFGRSTNADSDPSATDADTICTISNEESSYPATSSGTTLASSNTTGLPAVLLTLLASLSSLLKPFLPTKTYTLLFPSTTSQPRQAIINLYAPGEGISPHVDLLKRYGDGIIGVSLSSGCVMRFDKEARSRELTPSLTDDSEDQSNRWDLYLPERSVLVLTEDARYNWTHGIERLTRDYVATVDVDQTSPDSQEAARGRWLERGVRLSVTFRWLLVGADVVGPSDDN